MIKRIALSLALTLLPVVAFAQIKQTGTVTPGHALRWITNGVAGDAGGAAGSTTQGSGYLTELGITNTGTPFCVSDALINAANGYHQLCLGANSLGGGLISYNAYGGATPLSLNFNINGTTFAFPGAGTGDVVGPSSTPQADSLAAWNGGLTLKSLYNTTSLGSLIGVQVEPNAGFAAWGTLPLAVGANGTSALNGSANNNLAAGTVALPTGTTGYGKVSAGSSGNQVFGVYGLGELFATVGTTLGAEFTTRNFSGAGNIDTAMPPNSAIPNTTRNAKGVNITCGAGHSELGDCSLGLHITNETGSASDPSFSNGQLIDRFRLIGLMVEAQPSGTQTSALLRNNGDGIHLQLQTTEVAQDSNAVFIVTDKDSVDHASIRQNGDTYIRTLNVQGHTGNPALSSCGSGPSINSNATDTKGIVTAGSGATACTITFQTAFSQIPACVVTPETGASGLSITAKSAAAFTVSGTLSSSNFDYICLQ